MQGFVVRCLHDVCACCGCCVYCVVSSSFCPFQRCCDACLSGSENSSDVTAPVVISIASELPNPTSFPVKKNFWCCGCCCWCCCCAASLCCRSPTHCVSWCTCVVNAAMFSCSVMLRERCAVAAAAARAVVQNRRSATMQVVSMRMHSFVNT